MRVGIQKLLFVIFKTVQHNENHIALHLGLNTHRRYSSNLSTYLLAVGICISSYSHLAIVPLTKSPSSHLPESDSKSEVNANSSSQRLATRDMFFRELQIFQMPFPASLLPRAEWPLPFHARSASGWKGP